MRRLTTLREVDILSGAILAALVRHLVSDDAAFITGQTLNVNGGLLT